MLDVFKNNKNKNNDMVLDKNNIPKHIAIIMDGNGRWAKKRKLPRTMGHKSGVEAIRKIVREAQNIGVKYLTLYAFSTENWKRPQEEVSALMKLLIQYLRSELEELNRNRVSIRISGDITKLPREAQKEIEDSVTKTENNNGIVLNIAFNYGGRDEIIRAVKLIGKDLLDSKFDLDSIDEKVFESYLYTANMPDPDLIIRPSGEKRISNFLLWQCAYSEFWYSNIFWPDFTEKDLHEAIFEYQNRDRRYGGI